ncbi:PIG-L family deacetylase [Nocardioides sp. WS12]|uniref:PIG-L deacetylase family protein n=1 Tax=Nocardioides sp. WS12 TaxID=2486272 RepID=UPI0015FC36F6|nr:PIG-L family deacetylase [Nocardioides sp. WS12]
MPRNRTLVCVVAHPDDDAHAIAGTIALHADEPDFRFVLVHATRGELGDIREGFAATRETLASVRQAEDEAAWAALGRVPDRHEWLGLPDGGVSSVPLDDVVAALEQVLLEEQPSVVVTFGPDGISGHPDHVTIGAATDAAFFRVQARGKFGLRRLAHTAVPQSVVDRWNERRRELGLFAFDPTEVYHLRGVPDERIGITIDCRTVADRIGAGLREHRSQHHVMSDDPDNPEQWNKRIKYEWHVIAWPPPEAETPALTDLFDGLS